MAQLMPLTVSCFSKIQIGFTFLVPAHPDSPGQRVVKRVCVCVCVCPSVSTPYINHWATVEHISTAACNVCIQFLRSAISSLAHCAVFARLLQAAICQLSSTLGNAPSETISSVDNVCDARPLDCHSDRQALHDSVAPVHLG